ncbi:MAG TPA: 50S ribosomal protein L23 [Candidatus Megaira endosymbiont of Nemacystus decipiens]|nr:50S ribosomal protein L23 [Candidatus Megaera endosymbiont of Nemacystus decipiens]
MIKANYDLIRKPIITEKSTFLGEQGKYVFEVSKDATKPLIRKAVESIFEVKVTSVNILNQKGKVKKFKGTLGRRPDVKKAIVSLEKGSSIDFSGVVK